MGGQNTKAKIVHYSLPQPLVVTWDTVHFLTDAKQSIKDAYATGVRMVATSEDPLLPLADAIAEFRIYDTTTVLTTCEVADWEYTICVAILWRADGSATPCREVPLGLVPQLPLKKLAAVQRLPPQLLDDMGRAAKALAINELREHKRAKDARDPDMLIT